MAISFSLGGKKGSSSFEESSKATALKTTKDVTKTTGLETLIGTQDQTQTQKGTTTGTTTGTQEQTQLTSLLDEGTQERLRQLVFDITGDEGAAGGLVELLASRATEADEFQQQQTAAIVGEARRTGEIRVGVAEQSAARGAGSSLNTIVQQLGLEERAALESQLASLEATLGLQGRQAATDEITGAVKTATGAQAGQAGAAASLADVLKGATQETTTSVATQEQTQQIQDLVSILASLTGQTKLTDLTEILTGKATAETTETARGTGKSREKGAGIGISI